MKRKYVKCLIVIVVVIIGGLFIYQNISKENKPLPEVKLKEIINKNKSFAIMVQEQSETDKYQEYSSNTWPGDDYKFKEAKCIDNSGDEVKDAVTYENDKITLTTNKTVYCTVYFDKSIIGKLRENEELANKDNLSKDKQGGMYRYQGTDDVHNWICFGTIDNCGTNDDNIDKYMYRIIGITPEGQLYLLKETFLKEESTIGFAYNDTYTIKPNEVFSCPNNICPEWNNSLLYKRINGISNGNTKGSGTYLNKSDTDIFVDSKEYDYLKSGDENGTNDKIGNEWYQLIADHNWMYGDTIVRYYNGDKMYNIEKGISSTEHYVGTYENISKVPYTWSTEKSINAKIGLLYLYDYMFAYYDGNSTITRGNPGDATNVANSWIFFRKDNYNSINIYNNDPYEYLITQFGIRDYNNYSFYAYSVSSSGYVNDNALGGYTYACGIRPVFYLNSNAKIANGDGTKANPYILDVQE